MHPVLRIVACRKHKHLPYSGQVIRISWLNGELPSRGPSGQPQLKLATRQLPTLCA